MARGQGYDTTGWILSKKKLSAGPAPAPKPPAAKPLTEAKPSAASKISGAETPAAGRKTTNLQTSKIPARSTTMTAQPRDGIVPFTRPREEKEATLAEWIEKWSNN